MLSTLLTNVLSKINIEIWDHSALAVCYLNLFYGFVPRRVDVKYFPYSTYFNKATGLQSANVVHFGSVDFKSSNIRNSQRFVVLVSHSVFLK